jgi:hypothetical protein
VTVQVAVLGRRSHITTDNQSGRQNNNLDRQESLIGLYQGKMIGRLNR